ncbi:hypothetical protein [Agromyces italicus]|uniref:hypothetical protein n=1 Tax=Agromyces italicus TaxID=279572 RepID=UPI0003B3B5D4|nr:hypothetical protein [Agromyces italicus]
MSQQQQKASTGPHEPSPDGPPDRPEWPGIQARTWQRIGEGLSLASIVLLIAVALAELDRLIASVPDAAGQSHSLNLALSPFSLLQRTSWSAWAEMPWHTQIGQWIILSAALDAVMVVAYAILLHRLILTAPRSAQAVPAIAFATILASECLEAALQIGAGAAVATGMTDVAHSVGRLIAFVTLAKVLGFIVLAVAVMRIPEYRSWIGGRLRRLGRAIWVHRLAALVILALFVLACIPAADLLDQLPDVERQWADGRLGGWHAAFGITALLVTGLLTFALNRRRTRYMIETRVHGWVGRPSPSWLHAAGPWLIAPAAQLLLAVITLLIAALNGSAAAIHLPTFLAILGVELAVAVLAAVTWPWSRRHPESPRTADVERAADSWIVGDSLAAIVLVVGAIGVVRSFLVPIVLGGSDAGILGWVLVPFSVVVVVLAPWATLTTANVLTSGARLARRSRLDPTDARHPDGVHVSKSGWVEWLAFVAGAAVLLGGLLFPAQIGATFGAVAVMLVSLGAWVAVFGAFTLIVQARELIAPFRWMNMRAAPIITLGLIVPLVINVALAAMPWKGASDTALHEVHVSNTEPAANPVEPDALRDRLEALRADTECAVPLEVGDDGEPDESGPSARPVFLIASEGGGIRAAYWTASVLGALDGCAARSGLIASGISGGSVGLALASAIDDRAQRDPEAIVSEARNLSGPESVSSAALGLVVGDAVAGGWGVHVPSYLDPELGDDEGWRWRDRAALIESWWENGTSLGEPFTNEIDPLTGALLMNSADVVTKCRLLVQQAPIIADRSDPAAHGEGRIGPCDGTGGLPSMLQFDELPGLADAQDASDCLAGLDWSTAAMLSARFAVITPTGSLPGQSPCGDVAGAQFVDGGYVEPTSLATIADIAPALMARFAEVNARPGSNVTLVPVLLYLRNSQGYDLVTDIARAEAEPLAPITGNAARVRLTGQDAWIQRIALSMPESCPGERATGDAGQMTGDRELSACRTAFDAVVGPGGTAEGGVIVVAPASEPAVVPPLGWALSEASQARFSAALHTAANCPGQGDRSTRAERAAASHHYPGLDTVPALFGEEKTTEICGRIDAQLEGAD